MAGAPQGGAELFFERMSLALAATGATVLPLIRQEPARMGRLTAAGLRPGGYRFGGPLDRFTRPALRRALRDGQADVAIAWMSRAASHLPRGPWLNIGRLGGYYDLKYFRSCRHLIGNTQGIVAYLRAEGVASAQAHYLPNFVDDFAATSPACRSSFNLPEGPPLLLGLGRLHEVKGFDILIRAVAAIPDACCIIAGEGPARPRLEALVAELGLAHRVVLPGWARDVGPLLKAADVFISSSRHEPLGNMVLEAFSAARPVLAAKAEGPAELIRPGEDGVLVPLENPAALAAAARDLLNRPAHAAALAAAGRRRYEAEFAQTPVTANWLDLLRRLVG